jgi:anaerobic magnesium-protoporphyrin IX monomethyl ester cyclase
MKVLLTSINSKYIQSNLAIRILYELNKDYKAICLKEFFNKENPEDIAVYCAGFDLAAFSCYIWNIDQTLEVALKIKDLNPRCQILLGGPEVSFEWQDIANLPQIDFIILGEGEIPFKSFLKSYPILDKVPALVWKSKGSLIENKIDEAFDLATLKEIVPYANDYGEVLRNKITYVEASRGCPHSCAFCLAGLEGKLRYFHPENVQKSLLHLMQNGKNIKFLDRTFNAKQEVAINIFRFILQNYQAGNVFQFEMKADAVQPKLVDYIRQNVPKGVFRFEIGIQTLNSHSNKTVGRYQNFDNIRSFFNQVSGIVETHLDLIVGLPHDYWNDIKYSFDEVFRLFAPELQLGFLKLLKGSPLRQNAAIHQYRFSTKPPYQVLSSKYLSEDEFNQIRLIEKALNIYWNRKKAIHTLKYVADKTSAFDFLLGLGKYFEQKAGFGQYGTNEIYTYMHEYATDCFPGDQIITGLLALDYYLHFKVKPEIRFLPEADKTIRDSLLSNIKPVKKKYRYIVHPLNFKIAVYFENNQIVSGDSWLIVRYDGQNQAEVVLADWV